MTTEFLRQLTIELPEGADKKLFTLLSMKGIEVYGKNAGTEEYHILTDPSEASDGLFYVSAADRDMAATIMDQAGLGAYISESKKVQSEAESFLEHAEEEYYRKRKITMLESLVVIGGALLYYLYKTMH